MPTHEEMLAWERLLTSIGEQLDGEWELKIPDSDNWHKWGNLLNHAEQIYLSFYVDSYRKKLWVGVDLPKNDKGEKPYIGHLGLGDEPKIGMSPDKPAEQIVRDIERRLLPAYRPMLAKALQLIEQANAYHNKVESMAKEIAKIVEVDIPEDRSGRPSVKSTVNFYHSRLPGFRENLGSAEVHDDDVKLELRLSHPDTIAVLKFLTGK